MATLIANNNESSQPTCQNCQTSTTPLWRRDELGSVLCNACGLFLKLHGRPRPISLKTDVIKSRNRVKSSGSAQGVKKKVRNCSFGLEGEDHLTRIVEPVRFQWPRTSAVARRDTTTWTTPQPSPHLPEICQRPFRWIQFPDFTNCYSLNVRQPPACL
jgi:Zn ribbon nucleic-acid-binding protein